eukprot:391079-Rhodomonas_salina.1
MSAHRVHVGTGQCELADTLVFPGPRCDCHGRYATVGRPAGQSYQELARESESGGVHGSVGSSAGSSVGDSIGRSVGDSIIGSSVGRA